MLYVVCAPSRGCDGDHWDGPHKAIVEDPIRYLFKERAFLPLLLLISPFHLVTSCGLPTLVYMELQYFLGCVRGYTLENIAAW